MLQTSLGWLGSSLALTQPGVFEAIPFLAVTGVFFVLLYGPILLKLYWPTLRARRLHYGFAEVEDSTVASGPKPGGDPDQVFYWPEVSYSYFARGRGHSSSRLSAAPVYYSERAEAAEVAARYKPGEKIRIHFDLERPEEVLVQLPRPPDEAGVLLFGLLCLVLSAGLAYLVLDLLPAEALELFRSSPAG